MSDSFYSNGTPTTSSTAFTAPSSDSNASLRNKNDHHFEAQSNSNSPLRRNSDEIHDDDLNLVSNKEDRETVEETSLSTYQFFDQEEIHEFQPCRLNEFEEPSKNISKLTRAFHLRDIIKQN